MPRTSTQKGQTRRTGQRGAAIVEYVVILTLVMIGATLASLPLGGHLLDYYDVVEFLTGLPFP